jgi:hypothetical protein
LGNELPEANTFPHIYPKEKLTCRISALLLRVGVTTRFQLHLCLVPLVLVALVVVVGVALVRFEE